MTRIRALSATLALLASTACSRPDDRAPVRPVRIVATVPHDPSAFTEGLFIEDGAMWESTGRNGRSEIRRTDLATGVVDRRVRLPSDVFGEGIAPWKDEVVSLTWKGGIGYRWHAADLSRMGEFRYGGEGWGLAAVPGGLAMTDGTPAIRFLNGDTAKETARITVHDGKRLVSRLNEIEWIDGRIWANVWHSGMIAVVDPGDGRVVEWLDLRPILALQHLADPESVLNGIAFDARTRSVYATGKNWTAVYKIEVVR